MSGPFKSLLVLARHGNTFDDSRPVVWVGRNEDLPLVSSGKEQAEAIASVVKGLGFIPSEVLSSPLKRAFMTASALNVPVTVLPELNEIDYGPWGGLSDEEIRALGHSQALEDWNTRGEIPEDGIWGSSESELDKQIVQLTDTLKERAEMSELVLAITSNGILKLLYKAVVGGLPPKVKTGHLSVLSCKAGELFVELWNASPEDFFRWQKERI